ncbi:MAG: zinc dependent phospholipase C family protein [Chryseotalea sp.]
MKRLFLLSLSFSSIFIFGGFWGFFGHKTINNHAVYCLPMPLTAFYKKNQTYLKEASVNPDKRRMLVVGEEARHYIDLDRYGDSAKTALPVYWNKAVEKYGEDVLQENGIVPWHIYAQYNKLRDAFILKDAKTVLRISADLGHYLADAHVPLHTTSNYNGQLTNQHGIHAFWESRLPEIFSVGYTYWTGKATYVADPQNKAWEIVWDTHALVDSVLLIEAELTATFAGAKFSFEQRGQQLVKVYSREFANAYHCRLNGMVENQMKKAIHTIASFWYSAWIDAGQPDVNTMIPNMSDEERKEKTELLKLERGNTKFVSRHTEESN